MLDGISATLIALPTTKTSHPSQVLSSVHGVQQSCGVRVQKVGEVLNGELQLSLWHVVDGWRHVLWCSTAQTDVIKVGRSLERFGGQALWQTCSR